MKKKILVGLMVLYMVFVGTTTLITNADENEMKSAEALVRIPDANLPKIAIVTSDIAQYGQLRAAQTNTKTKMYLYMNMSAAEIIETVREDEPDVIYLMGDANKIDENIRIVFNIVTPTIRMSEVKLGEEGYKLAGMVEDKKEKQETYYKKPISKEEITGKYSMATVDDDFVNEKRPEYVRGFNSGKYFDHERFISAFEKLLNEERERKGLYPLKHSDSIQKGTNTRAMEQAELGDQYSNGKAHTRPDGSSYYTAFAKEDYVFGECTFVIQGPACYEDVRKYTSYIYNEGIKDVASEEDIAQVLFKSWCNSLGHYDVMMTKSRKYFGVSVRMAQLNAPEVAYNACTNIVGVFNIGNWNDWD